MAEPESERELAEGDEVRIAERSVVVDHDRLHEGLAPEDRIPLEADVTGRTGKIIAPPYQSPLKDGEVCVPVELRNGAVVGVPEHRLELEGDSKRPSVGWSKRWSEGWDRIFGNQSKTQE